MWIEIRFPALATYNRKKQTPRAPSIPESEVMGIVVESIRDRFGDRFGSIWRSRWDAISNVFIACGMCLLFRNAFRLRNQKPKKKRFRNFSNLLRWCSLGGDLSQPINEINQIEFVSYVLNCVYYLFNLFVACGMCLLQRSTHANKLC